MKDIKELVEYVVKNKYVILCVIVVILLYVLGVIEFVTKFLVLLFLVIVAIYIGKKIQDNESFIRRFFKTKKSEFKDNVYYYHDKDNKENNKK